MLINVTNFQGEFPKVANQLLPENAAKSAIDCRFLSGSLDAWHDKTLIADAICKMGTINTVYLMDDQYWLQWTEAELGSGQINVDVARGPIAQDTTERTIFTGTDVPRVTNIELATGASGCYPQDSYKLGVPAPDDAPELVVEDQDDGNNVTIINPGAELATTGWIVDTGDLDVKESGDIGGFDAYEGDFYFFGGVAAPTTVAYQSFDLTSDAGSVTIGWRQASGTNDSMAALGLRFFDDVDAELEDTSATIQDVNPDLTWVERTYSRVIPPGSVRFEIVMYFTRVGAGENDAFIDAITANVTSVSYQSTGSDLDAWNVSPASGSQSVTVDDQGGTQGDVFDFFADEKTPYIWKAFSLSGAASFTLNYEVYLEHGRDNHYVTLAASNSGSGAGYKINSPGFGQSTFSGLTDTGTGGRVTGGGGPYIDQWLTVNIQGNKSGSGQFRIIARVVDRDLGTVLVDDSEFVIPVTGDNIAIKHWSNEGGGTAHSYVDNIAVTVTPATDVGNEAATFTNYVFTYVNELGQEGPPSPVSRTIQQADESAVIITTPTTYGDSEYAIVAKRIYRAASAGGTTDYLFVVEIPLSQADYEDTLEDSELGEVLETVDWDLPPDDGFGVIALPNGVTAMASKNQFCPSVINQFHAYPVAYRLNFDSDIVAIAAIDTSVVIGTETYPYLVVGSDPSQMSSAKFEQRQACVSKRSMVSVRNYGVIYASPDGLVAINGAGGLQLLTEQYFSREEWQALSPESIIAFAHDDRYYAYYDNGVPGGFCFDPRNGGNGLTFLSEAFQAGYSDPKTDKLYLVADDNELYIWDDIENEDLLNFDWTSRTTRLPYSGNFRAFQVRADSYTNLSFRFYSNGVLVHTQAVTSEMEKVLPPNSTTYTEVRLIGTDRVWQVQWAEDMEELQ